MNVGANFVKADESPIYICKNPEAESIYKKHLAEVTRWSAEVQSCISRMDGDNIFSAEEKRLFRDTLDNEIPWGNYEDLSVLDDRNISSTEHRFFINYKYLLEVELLDSPEAVAYVQAVDTLRNYLYNTVKATDLSQGTGNFSLRGLLEYFNKMYETETAVLLLLLDENNNAAIQNVVFIYKLMPSGEYSPITQIDKGQQYNFFESGCYKVVEVSALVDREINSPYALATFGEGYTFSYDSVAGLYYVSEYYDPQEPQQTYSPHIVTQDDYEKALDVITNQSTRETVYIEDVDLITSLWQCYYDVCNKILAFGCQTCKNKVSEELIQKRDILFMYINVLDYAETFEQKEKVLLLAEQLKECNLLCNVKQEGKNCGCH